MNGQPHRFLTLRALAITTVAVLLTAAMVVLGLWQLGVYDDRQHDDARVKANGPALELADVIGPDDPFPADGAGQPVTVTGRYLPQEQIAVRQVAGRSPQRGFAVVTPLLLDGGSAVLVVRGASADPAAAAPKGTVTVTGVLQPSEATGSALDDRRTADGIRIPALVEGFDEDLFGGYVVRTSSQPADDLPAVSPALPDPSRWAGIRNLVYAVQWWLFAAFVVFMWWRIMADQAREQTLRSPPATGPVPGGEGSAASTDASVR